jgi:hypothetical protein
VKTTRATLLLAACGCVLAAQAQAPAPSPAASQPALAVPLPAPVTQALPPNRWTPAQIREAFQIADMNSDGQLTRGEAQRLAVMPKSFEDTDLNKDGVLTLDEYQASFGP